MGHIDQIINSAVNPPKNLKAHEDLWKTVLKEARSIESGFAVDDYIKPIMRVLCLYFSEHPSFEEEGYGKLKKGIFLCGNIGTGKTLLMKCFSMCIKDFAKGFRMCNTNELTDDYMRAGINELFPFMRIQPPFHGVNGMCFDDLGCEPSRSMYMGNDMNVMERIILYRYERKLPFNTCHFTSNIDGDELERKYGSRVRSRLREMCNFLVIDGPDRRK